MPAEPSPGTSGEAAAPIGSLALIASSAFSLSNFRGPLIRALVERGVRVYALAPDYDEQTRAAVRQLGAEPVDISLSRTGMHPIRDIADAFRLVRQLRRLRPHATFAYFVKPVIYGSIAARLAGVPHRYALLAGLGYTFTSDGTPLSFKRRGLRAIVSSLLGLGFRSCDKIFFQNDDDIDQFVSSGLLRPDKAIRLNGTGVDLSHYSPAPPVVHPPTFLLMARLLREKGIVEYAEAARFLKARHPEARFILLGGLDTNPGSLPAAQVEQWAREGIIEWHGHVDDVQGWIARAGVYVLPSYREGKPRSTQEAMAMARPIITTDTTGCRDTVIDGVNGYLVPVRDWRSLAAAMERFIDDPSVIEPMGRESRRLAEELFDVRKINDVILSSIGVPGDARH